jgi:hypothetical protein
MAESTFSLFDPAADPLKAERRAITASVED